MILMRLTITHRHTHNHTHTHRYMCICAKIHMMAEQIYVFVHIFYEFKANETQLKSQWSSQFTPSDLGFRQTAVTGH